MKDDQLERKVEGGADATSPVRGPVAEFLSNDHARLDALLTRAGSCRNADELGAYQEFRRGLLRHIAMEEKVLLPAAERARGAPLDAAARLRLDHGALAALMMPSPTPAIVRAIRTVLGKHNQIEEAPGGVYETCEQLAGPASQRLLDQLRATPPVPVKPNLDTPKVFEAVRRALARAGYEEHLADG
ncbi:MAG TPA: hemerythrin domain-containing protein [Candidatus Binataceae bacterium]|nr:hemerythrin domain-containing protein [Candidatus Binataceae bacterium]